MAAETCRREESLASSLETEPDRRSESRPRNRAALAAALFVAAGTAFLSGADDPFGGVSEPATPADEATSAPHEEERSLSGGRETGLLDVRPDPGWLTEFRGRVGETLTFRVTGNPAAGSVWGSDVYTDDSTLAAAAVHAGVLGPGETGLVKVTILPGQDRYDAATRHGITSGSYGPWTGSYRVERLDPVK